MSESRLSAEWVKLRYLTVRTADGFEVGSVESDDTGWKARFEGEYSTPTPSRYDAMGWLAERISARGVRPSFIFDA